MLSINGISDGEKIIPTEPIPLATGSHFKVIITFLEPLEAEEEKGLSRFCGIWEDDRDAEDIIDDICSASQR